jgi:hypothetical protein
MKLTIIVDDNAVYVDGVMRGYEPSLDLTSANIPTGVHALQWNQDSGWIEFVDSPDGSKPNNEPITSLPDWANACVEIYNAWEPTKQ